MTLSPKCQKVEEHLAEILEGSAPEELSLHLIDCDHCRDVRHEAELARALVLRAGADYASENSSADARLESALAKLESEPSSSDKTEPTATNNEPPSSEKSKPEESPHTPTSPDKAAPPVRERTLIALFKKRPLSAAIAASAAAALGVMLFGSPRKEGTGVSWVPPSSSSKWQGVIKELTTSSRLGESLEVCVRDQCQPAKAGEKVDAGSRIKTGGWTRATIVMDDGSRLTLDHDTELVLGGSGTEGARTESHAAELVSGSLVADIAHQAGKNVTILLPTGRLQVLGTKFALRALPGFSSVDVSRGAVKLFGKNDQAVTVYAGETGELSQNEAPRVNPSSRLSQALAWSEVPATAEEPLLVKGLGELRAKKPGTGTELKDAVSLEQHQVKVRISGALARTEVTEVFANHTTDVLEGIFRFPLPPDAQIERLALEVDGHLEEGAFVDRERASKIWRGAIVNANRNVKPPPKEEIIWVPGPWRDPALLEWQRGGRFELRVYPIPRRSSRKVILAYTQVLKPVGKTRRYVYPLAHDPSGSTQVKDFSVDVEVRGHSEAEGVRALGYSLRETEQSHVATLALNEANFMPRGDLAVEYSVPGNDREVSLWAYRAGARPLGASFTQPTSLPARHAPTGDAYVAMALRPELPGSTQQKRLDFVFVVDASRSMFGAGFAHARSVVARTIRELDSDSRVSVFACDVKCVSAGRGFHEGGAQAAQQAENFLRTITPEGASDVTGSIAQALASIQSERDPGRELKVIYVGDGTPTVGAILPGLVEREAKAISLQRRVSVVAVGVGSDSDSTTLGALAQGGGGVLLPYTPGRQTAEMAYDVLSASYAAALRDVNIQLPEGLYDIAPRQAPPIMAGGELIITARARLGEIEGDIVLRGMHGEAPVEKRYPVKFSIENNSANAFVPRLFAAGKIADLESEGSPEARTQAVALSREFSVASRYTSLLVLESPAMFKAFGLDNARQAPEWSGEEVAEDDLANETDGELDEAATGHDTSAYGSPGANAEKKAELGARRLAGGLSGSAAASKPSSAQRSSAPSFAQPPAAAPSMASETERAPATDVRVLRRRGPLQFEDPPVPELPPQRRMIPMRRVWKRVGSIDVGRNIPEAASGERIAQAERELAVSGEARQNLVKLYRLYMLAGEVERASDLAQRWSEKEPLDPEALTATADVAARLGDRDRAIRILGSVLDARPGEFKAQARLARLYRWGGDAALGCRFTLAIAQTRPDDAKSLVEAVRCGRDTGYADLSSDLLTRAPAAIRGRAEAMLGEVLVPERLSGDFKLEATWEGGQADVDLGLLHPDGHRISWLGAPSQEVISALDPTSTRRESLSLRGAKAGQYVVELVRAEGNGVVRGVLKLTVASAVREIPFVLQGTRATIAIAKVSLHSELVPYHR